MSNKSITTLVKDIEDVLQQKGGWDEAMSEYCSKLLKDTLDRRLGGTEGAHAPSLRLSQVGQPCRRKLWYSINEPLEEDTLDASARMKFLYGDLLEDLILSLAMAAGHKVEGQQDELYVQGVKGHRDAVIDGITVDVKSASTYAFKKFKNGNLRDDDPFGYVSQLSSYVYAGRFSEVESDPYMGAFLVVDKTLGHLCLDLYYFGPEVDKKEEEIEEVKQVVNSPELPPRGFDAVPEGKSGNMKLGVQCGYCDRKHECWPGVRTFLYSNGPQYLTHVEKEPRVQEVTNAN